MVVIKDTDLINHTQKIGVNFHSNIGKKLNGFFYNILTHHVWGSSLVIRRIGVDEVDCGCREDWGSRGSGNDWGVTLL